MSITDVITHPSDARSVTQALYRAAAAAGYAPSVHNTQPWRWRVAGNQLDLFAERSRMRDGTDPGGRLATLSCGAALHHARITLAAHGWRAAVSRFSDPADPDHLARLSIEGPAPIGSETGRRAQTIRQREVDHHPEAGRPAGPDDLRLITEAVESQNTRLLVLRPGQLHDLTVATCHAAAQWRPEVTQWGDGAVLPVHDGSALQPVFALLYGPGDERIDWLHAGEALSAGWLAATEIGVPILPLSAEIEVPGARETLRHLVEDLGHPYLLLRLGDHPADHGGPAHALRAPVDQIIERPQS